MRISYIFNAYFNPLSLALIRIFFVILRFKSKNTLR